MRLLVDLGNSRVKWALERAGSFEGPFGFARADADAAAAFDRAWEGLEPDGVVFCSVAGASATGIFRSWLEDRWQLSATEIAAQAQAGAVRSSYRNPAALGADRWANLLGARALLGAADVIVVDAGTAVTVDALRADGRHVGGAIFAGLAAARAGLAQAAPALADACRRDSDTDLPAIDTDAAVSAGTRAALAGAVERVARSVGAELERPACLLTGGDGAALAALLGDGWKHEPLLTMQGLLAAGEMTCAG